MNKLAIVGHPSSGLDEVESILLQCGMQRPLPSRRDGMSPRDIASTLLVAHECVPLEEATAEEDFRPIEAGPVWHGMALDLMLGNLDQPFWGWSDSNTLYLLNYWHSLDPQITFVLVYDQPQRVLLDASAGGRFVEDAPIDRLLANWTAYNGALLQFFLRHQSRCMLVSARQVRSDVTRYLNELQHRLQTGTIRNNGAEEHETTKRPRLPANVSLALQELAQSHKGFVEFIEGNSQLEQHLVDQVVQGYPDALQVFLELQAAASLPAQSRELIAQDSEAAWLSHTAQRSGVTQLISRLWERVTDLRSEIEMQRLDSVRLLEDGQSNARRLSRTNEELLSKLNRLQEELDLSNVKGKQTNEQLSKLVAESGLARDHAAQVAHKLERLEAERAKQAAESRQLLEVAREKALDLRLENEELLSQLHQVQEALEQTYLENEALKSTLAPRKTELYGAADRVKAQLPYRLGAHVIAQSRTLRGKLSIFKAIRNETLTHQAKHLDEAPDGLPPLSEYADYHEAERVKRHLSYRLGTVILGLDRAPLRWIRLPLALLAEIKAYRSELEQRQ